MANTLTNLIPTIYRALDTVSRELVGFIPAVFKNADAAQVAKGQTVTYPVTPAATAVDIVPGVTAPDNGDNVMGDATLTITKSRMVPIRWNGEEQRGVRHTGLYGSILQDQFTQAFRTLCNEIEADLGLLYKTTSRAYGTAGTTPFGTKDDLSDFANIRKILVDNGAGLSDLRLILDTTAGTNLRSKMSNLFKVNEAGSPEMLRTGSLGTVEGLAIGESAGVAYHTKGTGANYQTNLLAGYDIGDTSIAIDTGNGTVLAGDVLSFTGDGNKYVNATALAAGSVVLAKPGLRAALADGVAMTVGGSYRANMAFRKNAIHLVTRAPAMPVDAAGNAIDMADDVAYVTDPVSGLVFQICLYRQYKQIKYEVGIAWGAANTKAEHTAILLG